MIVFEWTDPQSGRRERRTFATPDGTGKLSRWLKRRKIPHSFGAVRDAQVCDRLRDGRPWSPDRRVWSSSPEGKGDRSVTGQEPNRDPMYLPGSQSVRVPQTRGDAA